jgi:hypothetical protein
MELNWLEYLEKYDGQNVDAIRQVLTTESANMTDVVDKVLNSHPHMTIREAQFIIESEFTDIKKAPVGVDAVWVSENIEKINAKLESLTEGEIRIIIHNDTSKGSSCASPAPVVLTGEPSGMGVEVEGQKRGRGRPKKNLGAPLEPTGVVPNLSGGPLGLSEEGINAELSADEMIEKLASMGYSVNKIDADDVGETGAEAEEELYSDENGGEGELVDSAEDRIGGEEGDEGEESEVIDPDAGMKMKWADIVSILDKDANGVADEEEEEESDGTSQEEYEDSDGGLEAVTDDEEDDEIDEELKTLVLKKPVKTIKVGAAGKINVDRNQATFSGGTVEVPEDIEECSVPKAKVKKVVKKA